MRAELAKAPEPMAQLRYVNLPVLGGSDASNVQAKIQQRVFKGLVVDLDESE